MIHSTQARTWSLVAAAALVAFVPACSNPPLEEIAAAEAAIERARKAEAEKYATETFANAQKHMQETYKANDSGDYDKAKSEAITARELAEAAEREAIKRKKELADAAARKQADEDETISREGYSDDIRAEIIGEGATGDGVRVKSLVPVYFDFDRYDIRADQRDVLTAAADWMKNKPSWRVRLEGHTDQRGEAEYNLALGQRRAEAIKKYLVTLGVPEDRLDLVSMGEEYPADMGETDEAYAKNRRVEFLVLKKNQPVN